MAINSITFGGVNSADFGIYISGEGVFNAPKRDVEMIMIPGRNGEFALDNGRFENIEVTYPAFNFEPNDYDTFAQRLSDFRNAICAQSGYQRLEDTFHPDEYRMAAYVDGLDIKPVKNNTASQFDITFNCKPQRFLKSGETAVTVASGDTLTNPTLFEAQPIISVTGEGAVVIGDQTINFMHREVGNVALVPQWSASNYRILNGEQYTHESSAFSSNLLNTGDTITVNGFTIHVDFRNQLKSVTVDSITGDYSGITVASGAYGLDINVPSFTLEYAQSGTDYQRSRDLTVTMTLRDTYNYTYANCIVTARCVVSGDAQSSHFSMLVTFSGWDAAMFPSEYSLVVKETTGHSTIIPYNDVTLDCEIGEAYYLDDGVPVSANSSVSFGEDLPVLRTGNNEIAFPNTITALSITPRWWKI